MSSAANLLSMWANSAALSHGGASIHSSIAAGMGRPRNLAFLLFAAAKTPSRARSHESCVGRCATVPSDKKGILMNSGAERIHGFNGLRAIAVALFFIQNKVGLEFVDIGRVGV